jgi:hypothetical protein
VKTHSGSGIKPPSAVDDAPPATAAAPTAEGSEHHTPSIPSILRSHNHSSSSGNGGGSSTSTSVGPTQI